jgi:UDP:flavonoid glycosyltransferase YjiC (YdhE family)
LLLNQRSSIVYSIWEPVKGTLMCAAKRILFIAEAVTLAHVARPIALARALDRNRYDVLMACDPRYQRFLVGESWPTLPIYSISGEQFIAALARGSPVYDVATLSNYVKQDLVLIKKIRPELIIGDFRLSLSISARLAGIPYATISNAYWSPYYAAPGALMPVLPISRFLPIPLAKLLFQLALPLAFSLHCRAMNRVRREHGLPTFGANLHRMYTDADYTLYADLPQLFPTRSNLPGNHIFLGPVLWSPQVVRPDWWDNLPGDKPIIYLTMGSSGDATLALQIVQALEGLPVTVMAAMVGADQGKIRSTNAYLADYLPGAEAAARSALVICNGGSMTCQQALASGVPMLGIASNMDQFLNMAALERAGVGLVLRADRLRPDVIRQAVQRLIKEHVFRANAAGLAQIMNDFDAPRQFVRFVDQVTGKIVAGSELDRQ